MQVGRMCTQRQRRAQIHAARRAWASNTRMQHGLTMRASTLPQSVPIIPTLLRVKSTNRHTTDALPLNTTQRSWVLHGEAHYTAVRRCDGGWARWDFVRTCVTRRCDALLLLKRMCKATIAINAFVKQGVTTEPYVVEVIKLLIANSRNNVAPLNATVRWLILSASSCPPTTAVPVHSACPITAPIVTP